eukprot:11231301-Heterocapsa_arctica.AAC.1
MEARPSDPACVGILLRGAVMQTWTGLRPQVSHQRPGPTSTCQVFFRDHQTALSPVSGVLQRA